MARRASLTLVASALLVAAVGCSDDDTTATATATTAVAEPEVGTADGPV